MALDRRIRIVEKRVDQVNLQDVVSVIQLAFGELVKQGINTPTANITVAELQDRQHTYYFCAYEGKKLIGIVNGKLHENKSCYLDIIAVLPEYNHLGIGSCLLEAFEKQMFGSGIKYIFLNTMLPAKKNIQWYERHGYIKTSIEKYTESYFSVVFRKYQQISIWLRSIFYLHYIYKSLCRSFIYRKATERTIFGRFIWRVKKLSKKGKLMYNNMPYYVFISGWKLKHCFIYIIFKQLNSNSKKKMRTLEYIVEHCANIRNFPSATGNLRDKQLKCLAILKGIAVICKEHNFPYWLSFGTLIGVLRHQGFVPWDDDIDICMPREEYFNIIPYLKNYFRNSNLIIREMQGANLQVRIQNKDNSVGVDIFPVGSIQYAGTLTAAIKDRINKALQQARKKFHSYIYWHYKNKLTRTRMPCDITALRSMAINLENDFLNDALLKSETDVKTLLYYGIDFPHDGYNFHPIEYEEIFPLKEAEFEGEKFFIPNNADRYLKDLYGDYLCFPTIINIEN